LPDSPADTWNHPYRTFRAILLESLWFSADAAFSFFADFSCVAWQAGVSFFPVDHFLFDWLFARRLLFCGMRKQI